MLEDDSCEWRQSQSHGVCMAMSGFVGGGYAARVSHVGAAVETGVGVEPFGPPAIMGYADAVVVARDRRQVADDQQAKVVDSPQIGKDAVGVVVADNPAEAGCTHVVGVQGSLFAIHGVEIAYQTLQAAMRRRF